MGQLAIRTGHGGAENVGDDGHGRGAPLEVPRGNLLLVDADDFLAEMIASGLSLSRPKWGVIARHDPASALQLLERHSELDAIITEIVFHRSSGAGKAFIRMVAQRWPEIPIFVMTHVDREETRGLETAEYISKPPDIDFLVSRIDRVIRRQRESLVRGISLPTFLQIMEIERKTCTIVVSHGGRVGEIFLRDGQLMQVRLGGEDGKAALFAMLSMPEHSLRVIDQCDVERRISASLGTLLMEWSVREDHVQRGDVHSHEEDE